MAIDLQKQRTYALYERRREDGQQYFVGRWDDMSVVVQIDRFHKPKPGENQRWIASVQPSARGGRSDG